MVFFFFFFFFCWPSGRMLWWSGVVPHRLWKVWVPQIHKASRPTGRAQDMHKVHTHTRNENLQAVNIMHFIRNEHATNLNSGLDTTAHTSISEKTMGPAGPWPLGAQYFASCSEITFICFCWPSVVENLRGCGGACEEVRSVIYLEWYIYIYIN